MITRGVLFSTGDKIMPHEVGLTGEEPEQTLYGDDCLGLAYKDAKEQTLNRFNQTFIGNLLVESKGNVTQAARQCGLERQALQQIMKRYGIKADHYRT